MTRRLALLLVCSLLALGMACGREPAGEEAAGGDTRDDAARDDDAPSLRSADGPTLTAKGAAPQEAPPAAGDGAAPEEGRGEAGAPPEPEATFDEDAGVRIPADARWRSVQAALAKAAHHSRLRTPTYEDAGVRVPLPGVAGAVTIDGAPRGTTGLRLELRGTPPHSRITTLGSDWVVQRGCEARFRWEASTWSLTPWRDALDALQGLRFEGEPMLFVRIRGDVPAEPALAFLDLVGRRQLGPVHIETPTPRRRFVDPVTRALHWTTSRQSPSHGWLAWSAPTLCEGRAIRAAAGNRPTPDTGLTGVVLLSYLGAGYTHRGKHPHRMVMSRGLRRMKEQQRKDGRFPAAPGWDPCVAHGFAALAMLECYGMTGSPIWKGTAQRALAALLPTYEASDRSPLALVVTTMGYSSARQQNEDAEKRGKRAVHELDVRLEARLRADAEDAALGKADFDAACGLVTRLLLDRAAAPEVTQGTRLLVEALVASREAAEPFLVYLASIAAFQVGGPVWKPMKGYLDERIGKAQRDDGHPCCYLGSWDPPATMRVPGGRTTTTAFHTLALEIFYRYDRVFGAR